MGLSHMSIFSAHPDVEIVAVCDPTKFLVELARQIRPVRTYTDYNKLLKNEVLDAVVVATPPKFHSEIVGAALQRSLHVFCEKPFCLDPSEGARLARLARAKGICHQVGYHFRYVGAFKEARKLLNAGVIGRIHNIRAEAYGPVVLRTAGATWRSHKVEGGGCLYDYASHAIDLMGFLVGPPVEVRGTILNTIFSRDVEDEVYSMFLYENGISGQLIANWSDESQRKMSLKVSVWGEKGSLQADRQEIRIYAREASVVTDHKLNKGWNVKYTTDLTEEVWFYLRGEEYSAQTSCFISAITGNSPQTICSNFESAVDTALVTRKLVDDAQGVARRRLRAALRSIILASFPVQDFQSGGASD